MHVVALSAAHPGRYDTMASKSTCNVSKPHARPCMPFKALAICMHGDFGGVPARYLHPVMFLMCVVLRPSQCRYHAPKVTRAQEHACVCMCMCVVHRVSHLAAPRLLYTLSVCVCVCVCVCACCRASQALSWQPFMHPWSRLHARPQAHQVRWP